MGRLTAEREKDIRFGLKTKGLNGHILHSDIESLLAEINALREDLQCRGIHTCHDQCKNPMCLMRKERDQYKALLEELNSRIFPGSIDTADSLAQIKNENVELKYQVKVFSESRDKWMQSCDAIKSQLEQSERKKIAVEKVINSIFLHCAFALEENIDADKQEILESISIECRHILSTNKSSQSKEQKELPPYGCAPDEA